MTSAIYADPYFWKGKQVLLTGHTGFKGSWMSLWLNRLGARVTGISLDPITSPDLFSLAQIESCVKSHICDIRDAKKLTALVQSAEPEIVFHLAAQPLVRASYRDPLGTFSTNVQGTANLLNSLRELDSVRTVVAITTDKVYKNHEHFYPYRETDHLGGHDPYSASKAAAEIVIESFREAFLAEKSIAVASARAGNVIGGGDWSEDRLLPDAVQRWSRGDSLNIRRPQAIRPWQHVLEPLTGYMRLAEYLWHDPDLAGAYNFGPETHQSATVREVIELARNAYGKGEVTWGDGTEGPHEAGLLSLETAKVRNTLQFQGIWSLSESVSRTIQWYKHQQDGKDARDLCESDIAAYEACRGSVK